MTRLVLVATAMLATAVAVAGAIAAGKPGIVTVAGTGVPGQTGDGGPATAAEILHPRSIAIAPGGGFVFADAFAHTVRRVWPDGTITTVAGTGTYGFSGDGGPATSAELDLPHGVAFTASGTLLIADALNNRIRAVSVDGTITTVAGNGAFGFSGDGGPAEEAKLEAPHGVSVRPDGGYLIPDTDSERVRLVRPDGVITTVAGNGVQGFSGDGGPATSAELHQPFAAVPTKDGGFLIADTGNDRIRKVAADGTITTVAGDGIRGFAGDGGPATGAELWSPHNLAILPDGGFLIADTGNQRVRRVAPDGTISTVAGTGVSGGGGDGGNATEAQLNQPKALAILPDLSGFLVADAANSRIRLVLLDLRPALALTLLTPAVKVRAGSPAHISYEAPIPTQVRIDVQREGRVFLRFGATGPPGRTTVVCCRFLPPGRYAVRVRAWGPLARATEVFATLTVVAR